MANTIIYIETVPFTAVSDVLKIFEKIFREGK